MEPSKNGFVAGLQIQLNEMDFMIHRKMSKMSKIFKRSFN